MIIFSEIINGNYKVQINLDDIYQTIAERDAFEKRWSSFISICAPFDGIFTKHGNLMQYHSESFIPKLIDNRPPLLLVFGNPAIHSVSEGFPFSYEGARKEHRIWKAFRKSGLFSFAMNDHQNISSSQKRSDFLNLHYSSPFRIAISTFFSFPSPASDKNWSGVSGVKKLFGKKALTLIIQEEKKRLHKTASDFLYSKGKIICFQKDAYENLKCPLSTNYSLTQAKSGKIIGKYNGCDDIDLFCLPPTRYAYTKKFEKSLVSILNHIKNN